LPANKLSKRMKSQMSNGREYDCELVKRCQTGDRDAFAELVVKYQQKVFRQCFFLLGQNKQDAEDAAQDIFKNLYSSIRNFQGASAFSTWLYTITRNHCLNVINRVKTNPAVPAEDIRAAELGSTGDGPQEKLSVEDCVRQKLNMLDEAHRTVVALVHFGELSYEEAAEMLNCPVGTIRSRLNRALERLRPLMRECL